MAQAEIVLFLIPTCPTCQQVEQLLLRRGVLFTSVDVTATWDAMRLLLRHAGQPVVPTVVAYGEVMVGFDPERLEQVLDGLQERADVFERNEAEEEQELRDSAESVRDALGPEGDAEPPELQGIEPLGEDEE